MTPDGAPAAWDRAFLSLPNQRFVRGDAQPAMLVFPTVDGNRTVFLKTYGECAGERLLWGGESLVANDESGSAA